jgi:hypothetical protein
MRDIANTSYLDHYQRALANGVLDISFDFSAPSPLLLRFSHDWQLRSPQLLRADENASDALATGRDFAPGPER